MEQLLRGAMHRSRGSFKATLNDALRAGLGAKPAQGRRGRFVVKARALGLRAGLDPASLNQLADDLEADGAMDADFVRFQKLRWLNPITGIGSRSLHRGRQA